MPRLHERELIVSKARLALSQKILDWLKADDPRRAPRQREHAWRLGVMTWNGWQGLPLPVRNEIVRRAHEVVQGDVRNDQLDYGDTCALVINAMVEGYAMCRGGRSEDAAGDSGAVA